MTNSIDERCISNCILLYNGRSEQCTPQLWCNNYNKYNLYIIHINIIFNTGCVKRNIFLRCQQKMPTPKRFVVYSAIFLVDGDILIYIFGKPVKFSLRKLRRNCTYDFQSKHTNHLKKNMFHMYWQTNTDAITVFNLFCDTLYPHFRKTI